MRTPFFLQPKNLTRKRRRRGYIMAVTMVMVVILSIAGTTTLNLSGVDQRIAIRNRQHMLVFNTSDAGTNHARNKLKNTVRPCRTLLHTE